MIGLSCFIGLLIYGYINVINQYIEEFPILIIILIVFTFFSTLLYVIRNKFLQYSTSTSLIRYRISMVACVTISSLLYMVLSVISYFMADSIDNLASLTSALVSVFIVYLSFYHSFAYINYRRSQYILFLRNFTMDDRIVEARLLIEIENICNRLRFFLMRIGNPRTPI